MNTYTKQQWITEQVRETRSGPSASSDRQGLDDPYRRTRKDGAAGIDGVTGADYEKDLEVNLEDLLNSTASALHPESGRHDGPWA